MINPKHMCRKHLFGEHVELHMLVDSIRKDKSIQGFLDNGLLEPQNIQERHDLLVAEMEQRGYNHKSPLSEYHTDIAGRVSKSKSYKDLLDRCEECRKLIKR